MDGKKSTKVHDLQYYNLAQIKAEEYREILKDIEKVEEILYNHTRCSDIWQIILSLTDAKVKYFTELECWKETLENKGEVND